MERLSKFILLAPGERRLLARSLLILLAVRLMVWVMPFAVLKQWLTRLHRPPGRVKPEDNSLPERITWALRVAARFVPRATCLVTAIAAQTWLHRLGFPSRLRIGVSKDANREFQAHAWVELDGRVVIGGEDVESNQTLLSPVDFTPCFPNI